MLDYGVLAGKWGKPVVLVYIKKKFSVLQLRPRSSAEDQLGAVV